ncbi:MAG: hypothetical protein OHK0053_36740 [Microscillaceae bacterium]
MAQLEVSARKEIALQRLNRDEFEVISLREKGLLLISVSEPYVYAREKEFTITYLDSNLQVFRQNTYLLPYDFARERTNYYDQSQYVYFFHQNSANQEISIFRLQIFSGEGKIFNFAPPVKMTTDDFQAIDDYAYFSGQYNGKPVVISYHFLNQFAKVLPAFYEEHEEFQWVQTDPPKKQVYFVLKNTLMRRCNLVVKPYSQLIGTLGPLMVKDRSTRTPRDGLVFSGEDGKKWVFGTYSLKCARSPQGVYSAQFENGEQKSISFREFTDFGNFFNHYSDKKAERMRQKVEDKRNKGRELNLNRKIDLRPELFTQGKQLILLMEGYYSSYQNVNGPAGNLLGAYPNTLPLSTPRNVWTRNLGRTDRYTNYQYNYAIVCAFDTRGRLLWDNIMKIDRVERTAPSEIIQVGFHGDTVITAYINEDKVYSKAMFRYLSLQEETEQEIDELLKNYAGRESEWGEFLHWYGPHFLYFGEQKVRAAPDNGNRIFHLTRLSHVFPPEDKTKETEKEAEKTGKKAKKPRKSSEEARTKN